MESDYQLVKAFAKECCGFLCLGLAGLVILWAILGGFRK